MKLSKFLYRLFIKNGFILIDADSNKYKIGNPKKENPIILRLLDRSLHSKLLFHPEYAWKLVLDFDLINFFFLKIYLVPREL